MNDAPPVRAVLFDVDGTLVDSNDLHAEAWHEAMLRYGADVPVERIRGQIGKGADNLLPALLPPDFIAAHRSDLEAYRAEIFARDFLPRVKPFPGVRALFERIRHDDIRIALASSGAADEIAHHLDLIGCADLVEASTSTEDAKNSKPDPDILAAALAKLGDVAPAEALVVGDSPYDMRAAKALGIRTIGLRCGGFDDDGLLEAGCDALFDDPADLLARYEESGLAKPSYT